MPLSQSPVVGPIESLVVDAQATLSSSPVSSAGFVDSGTAKSSSPIAEPGFYYLSIESQSTYAAFDFGTLYSLEVLSVVMDADEKTALASIRIVDSDSDDKTITLVEYSVNGIDYFSATANTSHAQHNFTSPITGTIPITNFVFAWDIIGDLGVSLFTNLKFKVVINDTIKGSKTHIFNVASIEITYGLGIYPIFPQNLRITNVSCDPVPKVDLAWNLVSNSDLHYNVLYYSKPGHIYAASGVEPDRIYAHQRTVAGYSLYRNGTLPFTPPGEGSEIADEGLLTAGVSVHSDISVFQGNTYHYKIATVANQ